MSKIKAPICPYCKNKTKRVTGTQIYPHRYDLKDLIFYSCEPCDAFIGTHKNSGKPLGIPANAKLRKLRTKTHTLFDPLWKQNHMTRNEVYSKLALRMRLAKNKCHIGQFTEAQCNQAIRLLTTHGQFIETPCNQAIKLLTTQ